MFRIIYFLLLLSLISCSKKEEVSEKEKQIIVLAQGELGKNLKSAIEKNGSIGAIEFCNLNALSLTMEIAKKENVQLKRVSDKPRNLYNSANEIQKKQIQFFKEQLFAKANLFPIKEKGVSYFPILTNKMCLQCHGEIGKDLTTDTNAKIQELYPKDKATGYAENQIRGIWVIESVSSP